MERERRDEKEEKMTQKGGKEERKQRARQMNNESKTRTLRSNNTQIQCVVKLQGVRS